MKKNILLLTIILSILISFSLQTSVLAEEEYKDKGDRFSLVLPEGWKYFEDQFGVYFEYQFENMDNYATFFVDGFPLKEGEKFTAKEITDEIEDYDYTEEGFEMHNKIMVKEEVEVDGVPGIRVIQRSEMKENMDGNTFSDIAIIDEYYFVNEKHAYLISLSATEGVYETIKKDFEAIADSFKIGSKPFEEVQMEEGGPPATNE